MQVYKLFRNEMHTPFMIEQFEDSKGLYRSHIKSRTGKIMVS